MPGSRGLLGIQADWKRSKIHAVSVKYKSFSALELAHLYAERFVVRSYGVYTVRSSGRNHPAFAGIRRQVIPPGGPPLGATSL